MWEVKAPDPRIAVKKGLKTPRAMTSVAPDEGGGWPLGYHCRQGDGVVESKHAYNTECGVLLFFTYL